MIEALVRFVPTVRARLICRIVVLAGSSYEGELRRFFSSSRAFDETGEDILISRGGYDLMGERYVGIRSA